KLLPLKQNQEIPMSCSLCFVRVRRVLNFRTHFTCKLLRLKQNQEKTTLCSLCFVRVRRVLNFRTHFTCKLLRLKQNQEKTTSCSLCFVRVRRVLNFRTHFTCNLLRLKQNQEKTTLCSLCFLRVRRVLDLSTHCTCELLRLKQNQGKNNVVFFVFPSCSFAEVKNGSCPAAYSTEAVITIHPIPTDSIHGTVVLTPGDSAVIVVAPGMHSYQWFVDNDSIQGATSNALVVRKPGTYQWSVRATTTAPAYSRESGIVFRRSVEDQPTSMNYILTTNILKEGVSENTDLYDLKASELSQSIQYFDGLGR